MDTAKRLYEALFLIDSAEAASDWDGINGLIKKILDRGEAEVISMKKWDDRRLAYEINKKTRGTYILVYFNADPSKITGIERDVRLSERIMRVLIIRGEKITKEDMERKTPLERVEAGEIPAESERQNRYEGGGDRGGRYEDRGGGRYEGGRGRYEGGSDRPRYEDRGERTREAEAPGDEA